MADERTPAVELRRLTEVPLSAVMTLLNEPRNVRHMPLAGRFDEAQTAGWIQSKDAQWEDYGYGPWAVFLDEEFVGWGGFQREDLGPEFGLVLFPSFWGVGAQVTRAALGRGFGEFGFEEVFVALPYTRSPGGVMARFGFTSAEDAEIGGVRFRRYRLSRDAWIRMQRQTGWASTMNLYATPHGKGHPGLAP
ncbi:GNAT family N-acetyltransferase [Micromonospora sp. DT81.3]|uniref:GNAT family N-acetyltransferase n=1 Tax=Micromonospora sp. DT81.3 TaxID=3416523 RepID=UPI003CEE51B5